LTQAETLSSLTLGSNPVGIAIPEFAAAKLESPPFLPVAAKLTLVSKPSLALLVESFATVSAIVSKSYCKIATAGPGVVDVVPPAALDPPVATLDVPPVATLDVPPVATLDVPPVATLDVPPAATLDVPPVAVVPPVVTLDVPPVATLDVPPVAVVPPVVTLDVPPLASFDVPPVAVVPPAVRLDDPPVATLDVPPVAVVPPVVTLDVPPLASFDVPPVAVVPPLPTAPALPESPPLAFPAVFEPPDEGLDVVPPFAVLPPLAADEPPCSEPPVPPLPGGALPPKLSSHATVVASETQTMAAKCNPVAPRRVSRRSGVVRVRSVGLELDRFIRFSGVNGQDFLHTPRKKQAPYLAWREAAPAYIILKRFVISSGVKTRL